MIYTTIEGLQATIDALAALERSLFHLHRERHKYHPQQYIAMAEGTVDEICKIRAELDASIGLTEFASSSQMYHPMPVAPEMAVSYQPPTETSGQPEPTPATQGVPASVNGHP